MSRTVKDCIRIYALARDGLNVGAVAKKFGLKQDELLKEFEKDKNFKYAHTEGVKRHEEKKDGDLADYIFERLPKKLQLLWEEIVDLNQMPYAHESIKALMDRQSKRTRQTLFLHALTTSNYSFNAACKLTGISLTTAYKWKELDPDFYELINSVQEHKKNFFEDALIGLCEVGDSKAIIHANRTLNKDRGYGDTIKVDVQGSVEHRHSFVITDEMIEELSLRTRKELLSIIQQKIEQEKEQKQKLVLEGQVA